MGDLAEALLAASYSIAAWMSEECELFVALAGPENIREIRSGNPSALYWEVVATTGEVWASTCLQGTNVTFTVHPRGPGPMYVRLTPDERRRLYGVACFFRWARTL